MNKSTLFIALSLISVPVLAAHPDPMGLSDYLTKEIEHGSYRIIERRITNFEVEQLKKSGDILSDGSILKTNNVLTYSQLVHPTPVHIIAPQAPAKVIAPPKPVQRTPTPIVIKTPTAHPLVTPSPQASGNQIPPVPTVAVPTPAASGNQTPPVPTVAVPTPAASGNQTPPVPTVAVPTPKASGNQTPPVPTVTTPTPTASGNQTPPVATVAVPTPKASGNQTPSASTTTAPTTKIVKGFVTARPTTMPDAPTRDEIVHMQRDIQHIERQVAQSLDLSLSAYAVAELPQATEGRSGISFGVASANGKVGEAIGFSSNFGDHHEYTIKISVSHAGSQEAAGAGVSYQW